MATSSDPSWVQTAVTALVGGGIFSGLSLFVKSLTDARKARREEPNLILGGAEQAMSMLERALNRAQAEIEELKRDRDAEREKSRLKDQQITELEMKLRTMRTQLSNLNDQVNHLIDKTRDAHGGEE